MVNFKVYRGRFYGIDDSLLEKCNDCIFTPYSDDECHLYSDEAFEKISQLDGIEAYNDFMRVMMVHSQLIEDKSDLYQCLRFFYGNKTINVSANFESDPIILKIL